MMRSINRQRAIIWGTLIIVFIVLLLVYRSLNAPAVGLLDRSQPTPPATLDINKQKNIGGRYVSFKVPTFLEYDKHAPLGGRNLEVFYFKGGGLSNSWTLNVSVNSLSGGLENDPSYRLLTDSPGTYEKSQISAGGQTFTIFSDTRANYAKTAFIAKDSKETTFGIKDNNAQDIDLLDQTLNAVLSSFRWR